MDLKFDLKASKFEMT